jgi:hypothetical protein
MMLSIITSSTGLPSPGGRRQPILDELDERAQSLWGEQDGLPAGWRSISGNKGREIRRAPRDGQYHTAGAAHQDPRGALAPENPTHAPRLATLGMGLGDDTDRCSLKCNKRRGLFGG